MSTNLESKSIEQLMAEADELVRQIDTDIFQNMKNEHRLQFEIHAQNLKNIKTEVQGKMKKNATSKNDAGAEGVHEAIQDIVKAMGDLKRYLT